MSVTENELATLRAGGDSRNDFLGSLLTANARAISLLAYRSAGRMTANVIDDAQQDFLVAAWSALDSFRTTDDGRGLNDLRGWCAWRGLQAVKSGIRERFHDHVAPLSLDDENFSYEARSESEDNVIVSEIIVDETLRRLPSKTEAVARVILDGEYQGKFLRCTCGERLRHSNVNDIAALLETTPNVVAKALATIRRAVADLEMAS